MNLDPHRTAHNKEDSLLHLSYQPSWSVSQTYRKGDKSLCGVEVDYVAFQQDGSWFTRPSEKCLECWRARDNP